MCTGTDDKNDDTVNISLRGVLMLPIAAPYRAQQVSTGHDNASVAGQSGLVQVGASESLGTGHIIKEPPRLRDLDST